ncbi:MAG: helix-turn-helix domain-containing protein [Bacteroidales bacterium]|jgi:HTH-type transcriptional regulator/antitoxin HigA|nr:helix-turn-helix domain-containing protein [Bacteroidales bacterium]
MKKITNEKEYNIIKRRMDELLETVTDENYNQIPQSLELEFLSEIIEEYEKVHYPISTPTLAEMLKLRMYEMGINQVQLAEILDVSPSRISEYLSGKEPSLRIAKKMCELLNISANVILGVCRTTCRHNHQMV